MDTYQIPENICEMFNQISVGILILNHEKRSILFANTGYNQLASGHHDFIKNHLFSCLDDHHDIAIRSDLSLPTGSLVGYTIYPVVNDKYLVFLVDISSKKILFETRENNLFYDKLTSLVAEIAHEIGNPLTSVTTTLEVLQENLYHWEQEKKREYLEVAIREIERLSKYLKRMRDFSSQNSVEKRPVFLKSVVDQVIMQNKTLFDNKNVTITCIIDSDVRVYIDRDIFYQVLLNLFFNSVDILPNDGRINLKVQEVDEYFVKLVYSNNGPPIPADLLDKIFQPFFSTKKKGRGIGLAVSLKLMTRMGGTIRAEIPQSGQGSKFILFIPLYKER